MYVRVGRNVCRGGEECMWGLEGVYVGVGRNVCRGGEECM